MESKKPKEDWKKEWQDMPEFEMKDLSSFRKIVAVSYTHLTLPTILRV